MSEQTEGTPPELTDEEVEAHLLKEALASGAAAASILAGSAAAMPIDPGAGTGGATTAARDTTAQHATAKAKAKKAHKQQQLAKTSPPKKPPLQP